MKSKVVIGYCDIAFAGCRALLGANSEKYNIKDVKLACNNELQTSVSNLQFSETLIGQSAILQFDHKNEDLTLLVINSEFEPRLAHLAAAEIIDNIRKTEVKEVIILSAIHLNLGDGYHKLIDQSKPTNLSSWCTSNDPLLNNLLQFSKIEDFKTTVISVEGKRAKLNTCPNLADGSEQSVKQLVKFLLTEIGIDFELEKSLSLIISRPQNANIDNDDIELMYL